MPTSSLQPQVLDTPTRAARATRPQTRAWKQLIADATNRMADTATQRAQLRDHLAKADRYAAKRLALHETHLNLELSESKSKKAKQQQRKQPTSEKTHEHKPPVKPSTSIETETDQPKQQHEELIEQPTPLFPSGTQWSQQVDALESYAQSPNAEKAASVALVLPYVLRDLRSKVVLAGSGAAVAAAPFLRDSSELLLSAVDASMTGATVTKRVIAEACERSAHALLRDVLDTKIWDHVLTKLREDDHVATRRLVVTSVIQLIENASPACVEVIVQVATDCLQHAATDKMVQVRDEARNLVAKVCARFGESRSDALLANAIPNEDARARFLKPTSTTTTTASTSHTGAARFDSSKKSSIIRSVGGSAPSLSKRPKQSNLRELIKARRAAAALEAKSAANENAPSSES